VGKSITQIMPFHFQEKIFFHLIHVVFPYLLPQKLAKFTEGKRQLFRRLLAHGLLCRCDDVQLKGTDGSLYNFSGFVSLTGRDISTDTRKLSIKQYVRLLHIVNAYFILLLNYPTYKSHICGTISLNPLALQYYL